MWNPYLRMSLTASIVILWFVRALPIPNMARLMPGSWTRANDIKPSFVIMMLSVWLILELNSSWGAYLASLCISCISVKTSRCVFDQLTFDPPGQDWMMVTAWLWVGTASFECVVSQVLSSESYLQMSAVVVLPSCPPVIRMMIWDNLMTSVIWLVCWWS